IAAQEVEQNIELLLGAGARHFIPVASGGHRTDSRNLLDEQRRRGVTVVQDVGALRRLGPGPVLGLFANSHLDYVLDADPTTRPSLSEMTRVALARLSSDPDGFFLMIEGSRIDHAGHDNDAATAAHEVLEFDDAFHVALEFARRNPHTLIVVTADHETGGLSLGRAVDGTSHYAWHPEVLRRVRRSSESMAARIDAGAELTAVLRSDAGISDLGVAERTQLRAIKGAALASAISELVSRRALVGWTTRGHTAVDVPVWAFGAGAGQLRGSRPHAALGRLIARLAGLEIGTLTTR
ncbi:MAG: alkaline phosphatase, partial [Candidatus Eisenbacteria bacterium]|nr:alkaline phosphatase [Candidatus Eisenbacteria bacterium]